MTSAAHSPRDALLAAAFWHGSLERASALLAEQRALAKDDLHVAATSGDDVEVARLLAADPASVRVKNGPRGADPLTCLCFSVFLQHDASRSGV